jgi:hypothetical protein
MDTYTSGNGKTYCVGDVIERRKASVNGSTFPVGPTWTPDDLDESWRGRVTYVEVFVTRETVTRIADSRFSTEARPYFRQDACDVVAAWKLTKRGWKTVTL